MFVCRSDDKIEHLAAAAARLIAEQPLASPFKKEIFIVQTDGMSRWLSLELAEHNGIFAGAEFLSPNGILSICEALLGTEESEKSPFGTELLPWAVMKAMDEIKNPELVNYIENGDKIRDGGLRRLQIALGAADVLEQYAMYRPELLKSWSEGRVCFAQKSAAAGVPGAFHEAWQMELWQSLNGLYGDKGVNGYERIQSILRGLAELEKADEKRIPERLICFGISVLPERYIELLGALSKFIPVYLFYTTPCRYYWGDIVSPRTKEALELKMNERMRKSGRTAGDGDWHYEIGNELLSVFGKAGRDFLYCLYNADINFDEPELLNRTDESGEEALKLLESIQSDIRNMKNRTSLEGRGLFEKNDSSICFASCHSPMRETEALQDYLLSLFNEKPNDGDEPLMPKDILVMCSDIEGYAPYIEAVFGTPSSKKGDGRYIPYSIADRPIAGTGDVVPVFLKLLDLFESRFEASEMIALLDSEALRGKFGLTEEDAEILSGRIGEAGIRWGIDAEFLRELELNGEFDANTWRQGLDRMLAGYAILPAEEFLYNGIAPHGGMEGEHASLLGRLCSFFNKIAEGLDAARSPKSLSLWEEFLLHLIDNFFEDSYDNSGELEFIKNRIGLLSDAEEKCGLKSDISFRVIKAYIRDRLVWDINTRSFITGGVTFCSMMPMRSIPFRVICMIGMNDGAFPRRNSPLPFDLMAAEAKRGDRNVRESDKYLFLETVMSARERLYISYVGRSVKDNSLLLPSSAVIAFRDYIDRAYICADESCGISELLTTEHPLQGFSDKYFDGKSRLFSFREDNLEAAKAVHRRVLYKSADYAHTGLNPVGAEAVSIEEFTGFFKNTCRFFLYTNLNVDLEADTNPAENREPFEIESLDKYKMKSDILSRLLAGAESTELKKAYTAMGKLPPGNMGSAAFDEILDNMLIFKERLDKLISEKERNEENIKLSLKRGPALGGRIGLYDSGLIMYRPSEVKAKDRLSVWIKHLTACGAGLMTDSRYLGTDLLIVLKPVPKSKALDILNAMAGLYMDGFVRAIEFFPETSWTLWKYKNENEEKALKKAAEEFEKEKERNVYIQKCFAELPDLKSIDKNAGLVFDGFNYFAEEIQNV